MKYLLITGLGGAIGSIGRYLMQVGISKYVAIAFPLGTFLVNISGCFIIGVLYGLSNKFAWMTIEWRLLLITGVCGGYTTFSSYSYECISLIREGNYVYFALYMILSVALGLLMTAGGMALVK